MTAAERLKQISGLAGVSAAVMLLAVGTGSTTGEALVNYSGLPSATAAAHLLSGRGAVPQVTGLDGVGVGRGNKSWWHDKEIVVDHRIPHKGTAQTTQSAQITAASGGVCNPCAALAVDSTQALQETAGHGDATDPELEEFAMLAMAAWGDTV
jgi:hypothetical protein